MHKPASRKKMILGSLSLIKTVGSDSNLDFKKAFLLIDNQPRIYKLIYITYQLNNNQHIQMIMLQIAADQSTAKKISTRGIEFLF